ncbi:MAG: hypothetical protein JO350_12170, partial [Candidatus Eremiobacteraeota bacterium]|nr:hypothetical protein [Candidatus Eremiobacteraeota bacterium]
MAARDAPKPHHARWLLAGAAFGTALVGIIVWIAVARSADPGFDYPGTPKPYVLALSVSPGTDAARSGLRTGDLVDLRSLRAAERYHFITGGVVNGDTITIPVLRDGRMLRFTVTARHRSLPEWNSWLAFAGNFWVLAFAALIAWRRPQNAEARTLSLFLSTMIVGIALSSSNWQTRWPAADAWVNASSSIFTYASDALFVAYTMLFARPLGPVRRALAWLAYVSCGLAALYGSITIFVYWSCAADPNGRAFGTTAIELSDLVPSIALLACAVASVIATRGAERTRLAWAVASVGSWYVVASARELAIIMSPALVVNAVVVDVANFILPLGLTYSVLNHRLLDVGFALNRATIFTIVSAIIVGGFMLAEWLMGSWLATQSHTTNLAVNAALVIVLGFSIRAVHQRVDRFVDTVFFRKRHEDEQAIREFAREAVYASESRPLLDGAIAVLETRADAAYASIELDDGQGRYGSAASNDPAIAALLARHKRIDLHTMKTALRGEFAYP